MELRIGTMRRVTRPCCRASLNSLWCCYRAHLLYSFCRTVRFPPATLPLAGTVLTVLPCSRAEATLVGTNKISCMRLSSSRLGHIYVSIAARRRSYLLSNSPNRRSPSPLIDKRNCLSQLALGHPNLAWPLSFSINTRCQQVFRAKHPLTSALLANFFPL